MAHDPLDQEALDAAGDNAKERERLAAQSELSDLHWLLSSSRGRRFMYRLLDRCGVFRISYRSNAQDTAFNEGQRNFGIQVYAQIRSNKRLVDLEAQMNKEQLSERIDDADGSPGP